MLSRVSLCDRSPHLFKYLSWFVLPLHHISHLSIHTINKCNNVNGQTNTCSLFILQQDLLWHNVPTERPLSPVNRRTDFKVWVSSQVNPLNTACSVSVFADLQTSGTPDPDNIGYHQWIYFALPIFLQSEASIRHLNQWESCILGRVSSIYTNWQIFIRRFWV